MNRAAKVSLPDVTGLDAPRILVAHDQPDVLESLRILLKRRGFVVFTASSPAAALTLAETTVLDVALVEPDGMAFSLTGKLYVALANGDGISVLAHDGSEKSRYSGPGQSPVAYDAPANIAFDYRGSLLVTNHAVATRNPASFAVLKVFAADLAFPLTTPLLP